MFQVTFLRVDAHQRELFLHGHLRARVVHQTRVHEPQILLCGKTSHFFNIACMVYIIKRLGSKFNLVATAAVAQL